MNKHRRFANKGFSLMEVIVVVAVACLLIILIVPQLLKYVEEARVSADERMARHVKTAFTVSMLKSQIMDDEEYEADLLAFRREGGASVSEIGSNAFGNAVASMLGEVDAEVITDVWVKEQLSSKDASDIIIEVTENDVVKVTIRGSHADASGGEDEIVVE